MKEMVLICKVNLRLSNPLLVYYYLYAFLVFSICMLTTSSVLVSFDTSIGFYEVTVNGSFIGAGGYVEIPNFLMSYEHGYNCTGDSGFFAEDLFTANLVHYNFTNFHGGLGNGTVIVKNIFKL